jgi:prepilin signal peptidase PulO-like enzyme (type II secretory pathway)
MDWNLIIAIAKGIGVIIFGWFSAGIINYISDSLPQQGRLDVTVCKNCGNKRSYFDILLLKECSSCQFKPGKRTWLTQIIIPILFEYLYLFTPSSLGFPLSCLLIVIFSIVFVIDVEYREIYTVITLSGAMVCLLCGWKLHGIMITLWGGAAGYIIMLVLYLLGIVFNRTMEKIKKIEMNEVALGFGDVTLSGVLGLVLGWPGIVAALVQAILFGGIFAGGILLVSRMRRNYQPFMAIPYAPFLIIGASILLFHP